MRAWCCRLRRQWDQCRTWSIEAGRQRVRRWIRRLSSGRLRGTRPEDPFLLSRCPNSGVRAPHRPGPQVGAPPPAAAAVLRGRSSRHHRTPPHPPPRQALALDRPDHRRPATARSTAEPRLTSNSPSPRAAPPTRSRGTRRPPDATAGPPTCLPAEITTANKPKGPVSKPTDPHARSRLTAAGGPSGHIRGHDRAAAS